MELKKMSEENMSSQENAVADTQCNCQENNIEKGKKFCSCKIKKTVREFFDEHYKGTEL